MLWQSKLLLRWCRRRRSIPILLSVIIITLVFYYSDLCVFHPVTQSCWTIISNHDPFSSSDNNNPQTPPGPRQDPRSPENNPDIVITDNTPSNNTMNSTLSIEEMGVDDLYQFALRSPRFQNGKDAWKLRKFLSANPWLGRGKGRLAQLEEERKSKASLPSSTMGQLRPKWSGLSGNQ